MQRSDERSGKATSSVVELPAIPEEREVGPYDMQTIWIKMKSVLGKRKHCTIAPAVFAPVMDKTQCRECEKLGAYVARTTAGNRLVVAPDTCAEVTMIRAGTEDASWVEIRNPTPVSAQGLSETTTSLDRLVKVPMVMRAGSKQVEVLCRVTPESRVPDGVDVFLGTAAQARTRGQRLM